jgi:hypothetical protein
VHVSWRRAKIAGQPSTYRFARRREHPPNTHTTTVPRYLIATFLARKHPYSAMAPTQSGSKYNEIDLTLSSPEPESKPRPQAPRQTRVPLPSHQARLVFERNPRPYGSMSRDKNEVGQPAAPVRNPVVPQQARPINPEHLSDIIKTTTPYALEEVLLNLCSVSPAFSNALVRGLAPHSSAAQGIISHHQRTLPKPVANPLKNGDDSYDVYMKMKQRLAPPKAALGGSQSVPRVQQELRRAPVISESDDDLGLPPLRTASRLPATRTPLKNLSRCSAAANRTPIPASSAQKLASARKPNVPKTKICVQCHDPYEDEDAVCMYHTGNKVKGQDGLIIWDCCHEDDEFPTGCQVGLHTSEKEPEERFSSQQKRPSASPAPRSVPQKRPRIF